jgi:hypothetical protein
MANRNNAPAIEGLSAEDIAEAVAQVEAAKTDLSVSGRSETVVDTNTVVEDYTSAPAEEVELEYEVSEESLDGGTVLTTYGEVKAA